MDVKLLSLIDHAEDGDSEAIWQLAVAYTYGQGVKKDKRRKKYYAKKLLKEFEQLGARSHGDMLAFIGNICFDLQEYDEAADWYMKSIHCFLVNYPPLEAQNFIEKSGAEIGLEDTFFWSDESTGVPPLKDVPLPLSN